MVPPFHVFVRIYHLFVFIRHLSLIREMQGSRFIQHSSVDVAGLKAGIRAFTAPDPEALLFRPSRGTDRSVVREHRLPYAPRNWMREQHILIVQDDAGISPFALHGRGSDTPHVHVARSSADIILFCADRRPDVVILNLLLPPPTGSEFMEVLRSVLPERTPIIVLSARVIVDLHAASDSPSEQLLVAGPSLDELVGNLLVWSAARLTEKSPALTIPESPDRLFRAKVRRYVTTHLADPTLTVVRASRDLGYSRTILQRHMRNLFGLSFKRYLVTRRVDAARTLFDLGETSVTQCGLSVGFSNLNYFTISFRRRFKMSPKQYVLHMRTHASSPTI